MLSDVQQWVLVAAHDPSLTVSIVDTLSVWAESKLASGGE